MRDSLGPEIASDAVQAAGEVAQPPRNTRRWILLAIVGILALQVAAAFIVPPLAAPNEANPGFQFPQDAISANFELPAPHVITGLTIAIIPVAMVGLEFLLNFMQALIFAVLALMFTIIAIESHDDHEQHEIPEGNIAPDMSGASTAPAH
jgi:hypothetical protein